MPLIKDRSQGTGLLCFKMNPLSLTIFLICLLHVLLLSTIATPYNATDIIILNCGATSTTTSLDGRKWEPDLFKYSPFNDQNALSFESLQRTPLCSHVSLILWTYYF
ncbi:hypothetical protein SLE2022_190560 [Rubroshorea leprosula]